MYILYSILLAVGFVLALPWFFWKGRGTGKYIRTFRERMGRLPVYLNIDGDRSIWIHAVSVGEVIAARPLVPALRQQFPNHRLFLSTTTMTGNAVAARGARDLDGLFYAPFDWASPVRHALRVLNPALLILIETELWPNLIHEAHLRGTRVALVNGRISPPSFGRYRRIRSFLRPVLSEVDAFLMQAEPHAQRIRELGAPPDRVSVTGSLKFDAAEPGRPPERLTRLLDGRQDAGPLWVAGSTGRGETELVLQAFHRVREQAGGARLLIAPRHPEHFADVPAAVERAGFQCRRRSTLEPGGWGRGDVLLLDTLGELADVYSFASVVFVGGSLVPTGGQNILEPAAASRPIVVGPHMENFQEIADQFRAEEAFVQVASADELGREVSALLADEPRRRALGERARGLVERNRGAVRRTVLALEDLLGVRRALGFVFGVLARLRVSAYRRGVFRRRRLAGPVVSVGNLSVGGSGKTPVVRRVAEMLRADGRPVAILSRGYGGRFHGDVLIVSDGEHVLAGAAEAGDEPVMLARALPGVVVAVGPHRDVVGRAVEERFGRRVHVLDDGFQHLRLQRNVDLVCLDVGDLDDRPLPAGRLREGPAALERAHVVLLTRLEAATEDELRTLETRVGSERTFRVTRRVVGWRTVDGVDVPPPSRVFLFAGIARPERFQADAAVSGATVLGRWFFPDHHRYHRAEIEALASRARAAGAEALGTTAKDAVRLGSLADDTSGLPVKVLHIDAEISDEGRFRRQLFQALGGAA